MEKALHASLHARLAALVATLDSGLIERRQTVQLALLAALAGEHTLLIGPPGTAKSELARRLRSAFREARYFERLLTRFTVPEELFGPLSISALEEDRYQRQTAGFLPEAGIAFLDEVFKANSAILNALLTLLNEREFDNGAGRQACPLVSVIGATNRVPDDDVADAFLDRFLLRVPVFTVSQEGFDALLDAEVGAGTTAPMAAALDEEERRALLAAAAAIELPEGPRELLAELRCYCAEAQIVVSDRRWVKITRLLRVAAASAGRPAVTWWDLLLLPWCTGPDEARQARVTDWLLQRLGVRAALSPTRLTRWVVAFEAQLDAERKANDLDYDDSGRLKFSASAQADMIADQIGDAKGGAAALRMTYTRRRRYGALHIAARLAQVDAALARLAGYVDEIAAYRADLATYRERNLWLGENLLARADTHLAATAVALDELAARLQAARAGFAALPCLAEDDGRVPAPVSPEADATT